MAVLCLLTNTPWPWPTPAGAASARGGVPHPERKWRAAVGRSAQAQRGRLGCFLRAPGTESLSRLGFLGFARSAWIDCLCFREGVAIGNGPQRRVAEDGSLIAGR